MSNFMSKRVASLTPVRNKVRHVRINNVMSRYAPRTRPLP